MPHLKIIGMNVGTYESLQACVQIYFDLSPTEAAKVAFAINEDPQRPEYGADWTIYLQTINAQETAVQGRVVLL